MGLKRHIRYTMLVTGAAMLALVPGSAAIAGASALVPTGNTEAAQYDFAFPSQPDCDAVQYTVGEGDGGVEIETTIDIDLPDESDPYRGTVTFPDLPGGEYEFTITCTEGEAEGDFRDTLIFARLTVEKIVVGDVPSSASFEVEVECGEDGAALGFDDSGGTRHVVLHDPAECSITETDDGGAESSDVSEPEIDVDDPTEYTTTVTNTFPEQPDEPDEPEDEPDDEDDDEDEDEVDDAEPAEPVEAEPDYTG